MKRIFFIAPIALLVFTVSSAAWYATKLNNARAKIPHNASSAIVTDKVLMEKMSGIASSAKQYAISNKFNTKFCFLADMSISSGKQRFFVYDMQKNTVQATGLVTHGRCNQNFLAGRKYGNDMGCGCTSLGKYKVGNPYKGRFGLAYKLYGLDVTNNNAYNRFVVLHSMQCVPEREEDPYPICQSDGCPTVSPGFLKELSLLIDGSKQPVLLWIYN